MTAAAREIRPARQPLDVVVRVPGSKSVTNRALLLAALAEGESVLRGALDAADTRAFAGGLASLGVALDAEGAGAAGVTFRVRGCGGPFPARRARVNCAEAGTAARFLLAAAAAGRGDYDFDAAPQLRRRPLAGLLDALRAQGARTTPPGAAALPLRLHAAGLRGGPLRLAGDVSSQFVSALLMTAPLAAAPLELAVERLASRPYVTMTARMMAAFGVAVEEFPGDRFRVPTGRYRGREYEVEPDASTASYFFAAAAVTGGRVTVAGLRRHGALQGDVRFLDVLERLGCTVEDLPDGTRVSGPPRLRGLTVDMADIPDTFMTLAAIAPFADGPVTVTGVGNVRFKESDRLAATAANLRRLGVTVHEGADSLTVEPSPPRPGTVDPHGDHRLAMAFAVTGLRAPGLVIADPGCVAKTCPAFFDLWRALEAADD